MEERYIEAAGFARESNRLCLGPFVKSSIYKYRQLHQEGATIEQHCQGNQHTYDQNRGDVEIGLRRRGRAEPVRLVGQLDVERVAIRVRVHGDDREAELTARPDHTDGDLPAVRDENPGVGHAQECRV